MRRSIKTNGILPVPLVALLTLLITFAGGCDEPEHGPREETAGSSVEQDLLGLPGAEEARQLIDDVESFQELLTGGELTLMILLAFGVALGSVWLSRVLHRWRRKRGFTEGHLTVAAYLFNFIVLGAVGVVALRYLFERVPYIVTAALALGASVVIFVLVRDLPMWMGGVSLILRRRISEGDRIIAGDIEGTVEQVGMIRLVLRRSDGARVYLTVRALGGDSVTVSSPRREHPVEVILRRPAPFSVDDQRRVRAGAALCPYRSSVSTVEVTWLKDDERALSVRFQAWSADAARAAEAYLRRSAERDTAHSG